MPNLEQRIAALEAEVAALKGPKALPRKPVEEEGVRVLMGPGALGRPSLTFPTEKEFAQLQKIIEGHHSHLRFVASAHAQRYADKDQEEHDAGFRTAFIYLATLERLEELPRADRYATWWQGAAEDWARSMDLPTSVPLRSFICAVAAHGDIAFSGLDKYATFGLRQNGGDCGRRYGEVWKEVLRTGEILKPVKSGELARA